MEPSRGTAHSRGSKTVGLRLSLIVALLVVMGVAIVYTMPWVRRVMSEEARKAGQAEQGEKAPGGIPAPSDTAPEPSEEGEAAAELPSLKKVEIDWKRAEAHLSDVKDGTYGIIESGSLWLLKQARDLPKELFAPDPKDQEVSYRKLMEGPVLYRGKPVTVSGTVGRVSDFPVDMEGLPSVDTMWVIEIFKPVKGQQSWVCTLLVSEDPGDLKLAHSEVRMKGYFYKVRSYEVEDKEEDVWIHKCPVVVGRYVEVVKKPAEPTPSGSPGSSGTTLLVATAVGLVVLMLIVLVFVRRLVSRRDQYDVRPQRELTPEEIQQRQEYLKRYVPDEAPDQKPPGDW